MPDELDRMSTDNKAANDAARNARNAAREQHEKELKENRAAQQKINEEKMAADQKLKPTPTPEEILAGMSGKNVDIKEPNGAPPQYLNDAEKVRAEAESKKTTTTKPAIAAPTAKEKANT